MMISSWTGVIVLVLAAKCAYGWEWAEFGKNYSSVTKQEGDLSVLRYRIHEHDVVRVTIVSSNATKKFPLLAVFREQNSVVPVIISDYHYHTVSRTLCPYFKRSDGDFASDGNSSFLSVELNSFQPVDFHFAAHLVTDFMLSLQQTRQLSASAAEPLFFQFDIPQALDSVMVRVDSDDLLCMVVSVQPVGCPVFDLGNNVISSGRHQTMTTSASISVVKSDMQKFYVVFVVQPTDRDCSEMGTIIPSDKKRITGVMKNFTLSIEPLPTADEYLLPIVLTLAFFLGVYFAAVLFVCVLGNYERYQTTRVSREAISILATSDSASSNRIQQRENYGTISMVDEYRSMDVEDNEVQHVEAPRVVNCETVSQVSDGSDDESVIHFSTTVINVALLSQNDYRKTDIKYRRYMCLLTIAMFYGLPVVQLVLTWQNTVRLSGDLDLCYYNYKCARPLFGLFSFNSIFSNIGYVLLGALLIILVKEQQYRYDAQMSMLRARFDTAYGVPQHNGLMYAIGIAIMMEGVMSASYHICPSQSNYQFDTSFMYIIGALGMLRIYQIRHPDVNASAHVSFAVMAVFIFLAMCGVYLNDLPFWIVFAVTYFLVMLNVSIQFYYKGRWKFSPGGICSELKHSCKRFKCYNFIIPKHKGRFVFLLLGNAVNVAYIVIGVMGRPKDFPSFLLFPFTVNLFLYMIYYMLMKYLHKERPVIRSVFFMILSFLCWIGSMYFFKHTANDWSVTPARSRGMNQDCILFRFYDTHDVWHFLSSLSVFLSFAVLINIDDDLISKRRDEIAVF
uniref:SID1 transmembrane family member 1 n=2 Tax=Steinernema glaseri TaxID=37863 RepID=A0A1I7Y4N4_9BILA